MRSARQVSQITYERALRVRASRDELVQPHKIDEEQWVLVRHENPKKFESKWFGPFQVLEKMMLGMYRLQDPMERNWQRWCMEIGS